MGKVSGGCLVEPSAIRSYYSEPCPVVLNISSNGDFILSTLMLRFFPYIEVELSVFSLVFVIYCLFCTFEWLCLLYTLPTGSNNISHNLLSPY